MRILGCQCAVRELIYDKSLNHLEFRVIRHKAQDASLPLAAACDLGIRGLILDLDQPSAMSLTAPGYAGLDSKVHHGFWRDPVP